MSRRSPEITAKQLLDEHGVVSAPVDVEYIARACGAEIRYRAFDRDLSGVLLRDGGTTIIGVNEAHPRTRQRFTIAHELGHLRQQHPGDVIVEHLSRARVNFRDGVSGQATDREEIEANQFAAALLMPALLLERDFLNLTAMLDDDTAIERLARRYEVSAQSMRFRLVNRALIDPV